MKKLKISKGFITYKIGDDVVIFSGKENKIFTLNETAHFILLLLKQGKSEQQIVESLISKYELDTSKAIKDVKKTTAYLIEKGILSTK